MPIYYRQKDYVDVAPTLMKCDGKSLFQLQEDGAGRGEGIAGDAEEGRSRVEETRLRQVAGAARFNLRRYLEKPAIPRMQCRLSDPARRRNPRLQ